MLEQLIVGVLLFVPCLALLPTTFVWYLASSLLLTGVPFLLRSALYHLSWAVRWNLAMLLLWRHLDPTAFPGRRYVACCPACLILNQMPLCKPVDLNWCLHAGRILVEALIVETPSRVSGDTKLGGSQEPLDQADSGYYHISMQPLSYVELLRGWPGGASGGRGMNARAWLAGNLPFEYR